MGGDEGEGEKMKVRDKGEREFYRVLVKKKSGWFGNKECF
jgi:hypothetical protein